MLGVNGVTVNGGEAISLGNVDELKRWWVGGEVDGGMVGEEEGRRRGGREVAVEVDGVAIGELKLRVRIKGR